MIGKIVSLTSLSGYFVMVCVEIDLVAPLISSLIIPDFAPVMEYARLHLICFGCGWYTHMVEGYSTLNEGIPK